MEGKYELVNQVTELRKLPSDLMGIPKEARNMSNRKTSPENKSYYGGTYIYFMNQKLSKVKKNKQTTNA